MRIRSARLAAVAAVLSATACADIMEPTPKIMQVKDAWIISDTASLSHTLVRDRSSDLVTCAEPPPDAAFDQGEAADLSFAIISIGGSSDKEAGGESESAQEVEMAGRTPAVMLSRELFYRTCEFSQNYRLEKAEALKLFNRTLDIVEKNWGVEAGQTTVTIGDKVTTAQGATISSTSTQSGTAPTLPSSSTTDTTTGSSSTGSDSSSDSDSSFDSDSSSSFSQ